MRFYETITKPLEFLYRRRGNLDYRPNEVYGAHLENPYMRQRICDTFIFTG